MSYCISTMETYYGKAHKRCCFYFVLGCKRNASDSGYHGHIPTTLGLESGDSTPIGYGLTQLVRLAPLRSIEPCNHSCGSDIGLLSWHPYSYLISKLVVNLLILGSRGGIFGISWKGGFWEHFMTPIG